MASNIVTVEHMAFLLEIEYENLLKKLFIEEKEKYGWSYQEFLKAFKESAATTNTITNTKEWAN